MPLPVGVSAVTVTGRYLHPDGTPLTGSVTFAAPDVIRLPDSDVTALGNVSATLDNTGAFTVVLIATDNADSRPTNFTYTVTEALTGIPSRTYSVALPKATATVDLADIAPTVSSPGEWLLVTGPAGKTILSGTTAPSSGVGTDGDFYLDYVAWTIYGPKASGTWPAGHALGSGGAVTSVAGKTGVVTLVPADVPGVATTSGQATAISAAIASEVTRADGAYLAKENNLSDVTDAATARTNLGITAGAIGALTTSAAASTYATLAQADTGAWLFNVKAAYNAKGDGKTVADGAMTSGSAVLACTTSTPFASSDVGKLIMVKGAAATGVTSLVTTITGFTDSGHVTLGASASTTVSNAVVMWATDDTAAIQSAINAAVSWATSNSGAARVFLPASTGFYGIGGSLVTGGTTHGHAQLTIPVVADTARKVVLTIEGAVSGAGVQHWNQTVPQTAGSCLVSFGVFASTSAQSTALTVNANAAVIGGPNQAGGYGIAPGIFSNMLVNVRNMSILTAHSAYGLTYGALDLSGVANASIEHFAYGTTGTVAGGDYSSVSTFATGLAAGLLLPANGANDNTVLRDVTCHGGYTYAMFVTEHTTVELARILYSWSALCATGVYRGSVGATHAIKIGQVSIEACVNLVHIFGTGSDSVGIFLDIDQLDTETSTPTFIDDNSGAGLASARGTIKLTGLYTVSSLSTSGHPTGLLLVDGQNPLGVRSLTTTATVRLTDRYLICDTTSAGFTATLPGAGNVSLSLSFRNTGSNTLTVAAAGSETIDGSATKTVAAGASLRLVPSGGNWVSV
jgi:hypothetical protein